MKQAVRTATVLTLLLVATGGGQTTLPTGSAPPALDFPHFPDRAHAFVWRNWNVVPTDRIAKVLGASEANVRDMAQAMGLPPEERVTERFLQRSYITIIRRNWHLLPYEQLLQLLDWTPQHLADTLREDDFLFIKLGSLKPRCDRLKYAPPDEATRRREAEIKRIVESEFGAEMKKPAEPRFAFLDAFEQPVPDAPAPTQAPQGGLRFIYSYFAVFGDPLSNPALDPYPDALLQQLAAESVNGVWLHTVLRDLAPSQDFPEFGAGHEQRLAELEPRRIPFRKPGADGPRARSPANIRR